MDSSFVNHLIKTFFLDQILGIKVFVTGYINGFHCKRKKCMCSFMYRCLIILVNLVQFASHLEILFQMNERFEASTDAKSQLKFLEELDKLEKKRHDDQEWEKIMKAAKV